MAMMDKKVSKTAEDRAVIIKIFNYTIARILKLWFELILVVWTTEGESTTHYAKSIPVRSPTLPGRSF